MRYFTHLALAVSLLISTTTVHVTPLTDQQLRDIQYYMLTEFLPGHPNQSPIPGVGIAIVHDGQVYTNGFGYRNLEQGLPASDQTLFGVGSVSKMLTSLFVVHALSQVLPHLGEDVLDKPVNTLAPNLRLVLSDRYRTEYITIRDLLSHRTCIADLMILPIAIGATNKTNTIYQQRYVPEFCEFRSIQMSYNQPMVQIAGETIVSLVNDGRNFEEHLIAFFRYLGMNDTRLIADNDDYSQVPHMSQPYYAEGTTLHPFNWSLLTRMSAIPAAAGVLTSSRDMARLIQLVINRGRLDGVQLVKEEVFEWTTRVTTPWRTSEFTWRTEPSHGPFGDLGYGLGWIVSMYEGYEQLTHMGTNEPYQALVDIFPALKLGVFTVTNGGLGPQNELLNMVVDMVLGNDSTNRAPPPLRPRLAEMLEPKVGRRTERPVSREIIPTPENTVRANHSLVVGRYGLPVAGEFAISELNDTTLYLQYGRWLTGPLTLRPLTPAIYDFELDSDLYHHLYPALTTISFAIPDVALVTFEDDMFPFMKDFSLDLLPEIPWDGSSCGPGPDWLHNHNLYRVNK